MQEGDSAPIDPAGPDPLILTATLDPVSQTFFEDMRQRHYPPERNRVPAHLTLFHKLPGEELLQIAALAGAFCARQPTITMTISGLQLLGGGVAYQVRSPELSHLHEELALRWGPWLTLQDQQSFRPHLVIQNKVPFERAHALCEELTAGFAPFTAQATGLTLWHYRGGPWEKATELPFGA